MLLDVAWRKHEAMLSSYDQQTTRAGAIIGSSVAVTALFGTLLVIDNWVRYAFLMPLLAEGIACFFAVKAWKVQTINRAPERAVLIDYRDWDIVKTQDQLISTLQQNLRDNGPVVEKKVGHVKAAYIWAVVGTALYAVLLVLHILWFPKGPHA